MSDRYRLLRHKQILLQVLLARKPFLDVQVGDAVIIEHDHAVLPASSAITAS